MSFMWGAYFRMGAYKHDVVVEMGAYIHGSMGVSLHTSYVHLSKFIVCSTSSSASGLIVINVKVAVIKERKNLQRQAVSYTGHVGRATRTQSVPCKAKKVRANR